MSVNHCSLVREWICCFFNRCSFLSISIVVPVENCGEFSMRVSQNNGFCRHTAFVSFLLFGPRATRYFVKESIVRPIFDLRPSRTSIEGTCLVTLPSSCCRFSPLGSDMHTIFHYIITANLADF